MKHVVGLCMSSVNHTGERWACPQIISVSLFCGFSLWVLLVVLTGAFRYLVISVILDLFFCQLLQMSAATPSFFCFLFFFPPATTSLSARLCVSFRKCAEAADMNHEMSCSPSLRGTWSMFCSKTLLSVLIWGTCFNWFALKWTLTRKYVFNWFELVVTL